MATSKTERSKSSWKDISKEEFVERLKIECVNEELIQVVKDIDFKELTLRQILPELKQDKLMKLENIVSHLAGKFVRMLRQNQPELGITRNDMLCVEIGGLCCNLGYGPFSIVYEEMYLPSLEKKSSLEKRTVKMFNELLEFKPPQSDKNVLQILTSDFDLDDNDIQFIREIISGQNVTGSTAWPYEGRQPYKAFLYEESDNVHNFFHTRFSLYKRAYNHKVVCAIRIMINEAMQKAQHALKYCGKDGQMISLSECHTDAQAYRHLTDNVIFQIYYHQDISQAFKEARTLIDRVVFKRDLYTCVFESQPIDPAKFILQEKQSKEEFIKNKLLEALKLDENSTQFKNVKQITTSDFEVQVFKLDFGMESENPIKRLNVYSKRDLKKAMPPDPKNYSRIFDPKEFRELIFRIYSRSRDKKICEQLNEASKKIAEKMKNGD